MKNQTYDVMNDVKKPKSDDFLTNLSKEKERQNNAIGVSSGSSSSKTNSGNYYVFSADDNTKSEPKTSKVQEPWIYYNQKPEHVIEREKNYVTNRYNVEKQNPSNETKALQTNLNSYGYVGKDNEPLNVDSAYGENTNYAFNNAWRNNEQVIKNREIVQKRDIIEPMLNAIYEPMKEKANSRKHNASKDEITQIQNMLINEGHTDWNGNPLNVTGEFDEKTLGGYEKYIQETTPKQEVYNMQKELNALEITDVYGNAIKQDGLLGPITDGTVQNFIHQANNITSEELEPVRGDAKKTKADYSQLRKNFAYYNTLAEPYNAYATNVNVAPEVAALKFENPIVQNKRTEGYGNQNIADANALLSMNPLASNKKNKSSQDFIPKAITEIVESQKNTNQYPNDTVHLNDYFWKSGYKTADIEGAKDVLSSQKGVYLEDNGDIDDNTAVAIVNYAKANNLTLEQASDRLVELGRMYNEVENLGLSGEEIKQLQTKLNNLGITDGKGNKLAQDTWLGENTLTALDKYADESDISLKNAVDKLLNRDEEWQKAIKESEDKNILIQSDSYKGSDSLPRNVEFRNPLKNKVSDIEVLDEPDLNKIKMLGYAYDWAKQHNDDFMADAIHFNAVNDIRRNYKYNGTGYGKDYIDNYYYENNNNYVLNQCLEYEFKSASMTPIMVTLLDSIANSGVLDSFELDGIYFYGVPIGEILEKAVKLGVPIADFVLDELQPWQTQIMYDDYVLEIERKDETKVLYPTKAKVKFYFHNGENVPYHIEE